MKHEVTVRDIRQRAYQERSIRSRMYARVLLCAAIFAIGATVWSDPEMREDVTAKADQLRPVAAGFVVGTPLEDLIAPLIANETPAEDEGTDTSSPA